MVFCIEIPLLRGCFFPTLSTVVAGATCVNMAGVTLPLDGGVGYAIKGTQNPLPPAVDVITLVDTKSQRDHHKGVSRWLLSEG